MISILEEQMPPWAIRQSSGLYLELGAQLCTRDGRNIGNAAVIAVLHNNAAVLTDIGTTLTLNQSEMSDLFHPPRWVMDLNTYAPLIGRSPK